MPSIPTLDRRLEDLPVLHLALDLPLKLWLGEPLIHSLKLPLSQPPLGALEDHDPG